MNEPNTESYKNDDKRVKDALLELYRDAVQLLKGREVLVYKRTKYILDNATFYMDEDDEIAWEVLIREAHEELSRLESFAHVKFWLENNAIAASHLGKMVGIDERRHVVTVKRCVESYLSELFNDSGGLEFNEDIGRTKADQFMNFFSRDSIMFDCVALIENFHCPRDEVDLGEGLSIKRTSVKERSDLLERMDISLSLHDAEKLIRNSEFIISFTMEESKLIHELDNKGASGTDSSKHIHERFSAACSGLSIFGAARIIYHAVSRIAKSWVPGGREFHPSFSLSGLVIGGQRKEFSDDEIAGFLSFWPKFQQSSQSLRVGIRWLNHLLCSLGTYEDHLIRAAIVLESTLLQGVNDELKYRLRLRGARLLDGRDRKESYLLLGVLYDHRSKIVHEGKNLPESVRIGSRDYNRGELVNEINSLCRDVVVALIDAEAAGVPQLDLLNRLDDEALLGATEK